VQRLDLTKRVSYVYRANECMSDQCYASGLRSKGWLKTLDWIAIDRVSVEEDVVERLIEMNSELLQSEMSSSVGVGECKELDAMQEAMARETLVTSGLTEGEDYTYAPGNLLAGAGVWTHVDRKFGEPGVLFLVTSLLGEGDFVLPNAGFRTRFDRGLTVMFDPTEVHSLFAPERHLAGEVRFIIWSGMVRLKESGCRKLKTYFDEKPQDEPVFDDLALDGLTGIYDVNATA
jgi:hypothetical protein